MSTACHGVGPVATACLLGVCLLACDAPAQAAEAEEQWRTLETVRVTATRIEASLLDVAEAVSVLDAEEIRRQSPEVIAELLRGVPGGYFQQTTPGQGIPIVRGLKGSQVLHLVDGFRLNNAFFRDAPNQYIALVDPFAIDRTELLRGSAPSLHGADAMGGVVQFLSEQPEFGAAAWSASGRLHARYASADRSLAGHASATLADQDTAWRAGFSWFDYGDRRLGGGERLVPSAYRARAADAQWRQAVGEDGEFRLLAQFLEQPSAPRVDELVPGYGQDQPSSSQYLFIPNRRDFLLARYRHDSSSKWFEQAVVSMGRQVVTDDRLTQDFGQEELNREFNESALDGLTLQFNSPWGASARDGEPARELVWGLEIYRDEVTSSRLRQADTDAPAVPVRGRFPDGSTMDSLAVYASNQWRWERLSLDAGLRYSEFTVDLPDDGVVGAVRLAPSDLTGDVHLAFAWTPALRLLANLGRGFRPPNVFDLGTLGPRPGNRYNLPNPALQPESVWSYDLGLRLSSGRWQAEAFAWYSDYRDKIGSRLTGAVTPSGREVVQSDNLSAARLWGLESGLRYQAGEDLEVFALLNYTRGDERDADGLETPADRIPPLNGRLGLAWWPGPNWRLEPWLDFAARQDRLSPRDAGDPRIDPNGTAGWGTINLLSSWQLSEQLELGLRLENLADRNYREHGSGVDAPGRSIGLWFNALLP